MERCMTLGLTATVYLLLGYAFELLLPKGRLQQAARAALRLLILSALVNAVVSTFFAI